MAAAGIGARWWPRDAATWGALAGLVAGPQLLGHLGLAYAMAWLPASLVASTVLLEPLGAALVAWSVLGEVPSWRDALGGGVAIAGVVLATRR
jgi:drug/metabolite transporter (DMT)-like permease